MANWSNLPGDLLRSILSRLPVADFIRSRAVCLNWSSAAAAGGDDFRRIPLLMVAGEDPSTAAFFSPSEDRSYQIRLPDPDIRRRIFVGSSHGFLVTATEDLQMHLLNPLTGAQFDLPPLTTLGPADFKYPISSELSPDNFKHLQFGFLQKAAALSSSPNDPGDCTIVLLHTFVPNLALVPALAFTRVKKDKKWTIIHTDIFYDYITYHDGRLFLMQNDGAVHALDLAGSSLRPLVVVANGPQIMKFSFLDHIHFCKYLVPTPSGVLLQVWQVIDTSKMAYLRIWGQANTVEWHAVDNDGTVGIKVYKIDVAEGRMFEVSSLGDQALFLAEHSTACLSVADFPEMKRNHAYMPLCHSVDAFKIFTPGLKLFCGVHVCNIEDGSVTPVFNSTPSRKLQYPIWVMPSLS